MAMTIPEKVLSHGGGKMLHDAREVTHGARQVKLGVKKVSHGARKIAHCVRKMINDCLMSTTDLLWLHKFCGHVCSRLFSYRSLMALMGFHRTMACRSVKMPW